MIHAVRLGDRNRVVSAAIVDDQPFDCVETGDFAGQGREGDAQGRGFVVTGNLDDEFHGEAYYSLKVQRLDMGDYLYLRSSTLKMAKPSTR